jgi:Family of unknown function (DUF6982)
MNDSEKTVLRFRDGRLLRGYLKGFAPDLDEVHLEEVETDRIYPVRVEEVKAIFFVRSFEGDRTHKEKKAYGASKPKGQRVFVKFRDGESLVGFLEGDVPWEKGFFLSRLDRGLKGFFLLPVDEDTNNMKVFVIATSVEDVTVVP